MSETREELIKELRSRYSNSKTLVYIEGVVDFILEDRKRIEFECRKDELIRVPATFINSPMHGNIWDKFQRLRELENLKNAGEL